MTRGIPQPEGRHNRSPAREPWVPGVNKSESLQGWHMIRKSPPCRMLGGCPTHSCLWNEWEGGECVGHPAACGSPAFIYRGVIPRGERSHCGRTEPRDLQFACASLVPGSETAGCPTHSCLWNEWEGGVTDLEVASDRPSISHTFENRECVGRPANSLNLHAFLVLISAWWRTNSSTPSVQTVRVRHRVHFHGNWKA